MVLVRCFNIVWRVRFYRYENRVVVVRFKALKIAALVMTHSNITTTEQYEIFELSIKKDH